MERRAWPQYGEAAFRKLLPFHAMQPRCPMDRIMRIYVWFLKACLAIAAGFVLWLVVETLQAEGLEDGLGKPERTPYSSACLKPLARWVLRSTAAASTPGCGDTSVKASRARVMPV
jgi:hypothetical protein